MIRIKYKFALCVLVGVGMLFFSSKSLAQTDDTPFRYQAKLGVGVTAGWGNAYGNIGGEINYRIAKFLDINAGLGFAASGFKVGVGSRLSIPNENFAPFVGVNLIHATGGGEINVSLSGDTGTYTIRADQAVHINGGVRIPIFYDQWLYITGGYIMPFNDYDAIYVGGFNTPQHQKFANLSAVGGIQIAVTFIYTLTQDKNVIREEDTWGK